MATQSARRYYRTQGKSSACRGKAKNSCRKSPGCRLTRSGVRKSYCRKSHIKRRFSARSTTTKRLRASRAKRHNTRARRATTNIFENL